MARFSDGAPHRRRRELTERLLPPNVLWQPRTTLAQLGDAGVARVSPGSALNRRALAAAVGGARSLIRRLNPGIPVARDG